MKNLLTSLIVATFVTAPAMAETTQIQKELSAITKVSQTGSDLIISAEGIGFSNDLSEIYLTSPSVNAKKSSNSTTLEPISLETFVSLWAPSRGSSGFGSVQPNATLSSWDEKSNYLESSFIIKGVEVNGTTLTLSVDYLTNESENIAPVSINSQPVDKYTLDKYISGNQNLAATVLVDDWTDWFDGRK